MNNRSVAIGTINIGERRREDYGDIAGLAASMEKVGLLHPIVVDDRDNLVAGGRRLRAAKSLGWASIEARSVGDLTDAELREIELEENLRRKDLSQHERSKSLLRLVDKAAEIEREAAPDLLPMMGNKSRGRPTKTDSDQRIADRIGVPQQTINRARQHVEAVEAYPELKPVPQVDAIKIAKKLDAMPEEERNEVRIAVQRHQPNVLAALTDRPPLPSTPTPHELAAKDPGAKFTHDFHAIVVRFNSVKDNGGIVAVVRNWPRERTAGLLRDVTRVVEIASGWTEELKGIIDDASHDEGTVSGSDERSGLGDDRRSETAA